MKRTSTSLRVRRWTVGGQLLGLGILFAAATSTVAETVEIAKDAQGRPVLKVPNADAATPEEMKPYTEPITGRDVKFDMVPIPSGKFLMGSPDDEEGRGEDEGPQHEVEVEPFWMGKCEVTWDEFETFSFSLDIQGRQLAKQEPNELEKVADVLMRPTKPYTDMTFGMGQHGFPVICMTELAAKKYCEWLSAKTGRYYRLPTEAEWEYACRAGTTTPYSFGDDPEELGDYAWYYDNSDEVYHKVGKKKPNPWGLHDMHGNVSEFVLDGHDPKSYEKYADTLTKNPYDPPTALYGRVARGGSWNDDPEKLRSAARIVSEKSWKQQDPQLPQSMWYYTDAHWVGFRVIRPFREPTDEEKKMYGADKLQQYKDK